MEQKQTVNKIRIAQRRMERSTLGLSLRDRISNNQLRQMTGVTDAIVQITNLKWNWVSHVADGRWTKKIVEWRPGQDAVRDAHHRDSQTTLRESGQTG